MELTFNLSDGSGIRAEVHEPPGSCRAVIVFIHGLGEYFGRYRQWCTRLSEAGYASLGADLPGHGHSAGKRGHIASFSLVAELTDRLIAEGRQRYPDVPVLLYGHSLGGTWVLRYLLEKKGEVCCSIVTSPWLRLSFEPPRLKVRLAGIMAGVAPRLVQSSGLRPAHLSRDPEVVEEYVADPLVHGRISVALFNEAMSSAAFILENASSLATPLLLMHGSADLITSPEGSRLFASQAPGIDLKIWEGRYHELHNDLQREEVFGYIAGWLAQHNSTH